MNQINTSNSTALTFIDLFCGCGGFTLGMLRAGYRCVAAIDNDQHAVDTLRRNLPEVCHVLQRDLTSYPPDELADLVGTDHIEIIVGGPPCQGFSKARQVDGSNHGPRPTNDPRRYLYREFLKYVEFFQPRVFVMENVPDLRNAVGGRFFKRIHKEARALGISKGQPGYRVTSQVEPAWELGVPQKRRRLLIIGVRADLPKTILPVLIPPPRVLPKPMLGATIGDLPVLSIGNGTDECPYDLDLRQRHLCQYGDAARNYLEQVLEISRATILTNHVARYHSDRDLRDFSRLQEGENSATAMRVRNVHFEFPYDKSCFKDRYTRQSRSAPCSTIVAHLSRDGLMFIHPTQLRSITPREAARIQSFPDWYRFPKAISHAFRLIGNAVPPLVSESIGIAISQLSMSETISCDAHCLVESCKYQVRLNAREAISV